MTPDQEIRARALELAITAHRYSGLEPADCRMTDTADVYTGYIRGETVQTVGVRTQVHALGCARLGGTGFDCTCAVPRCRNCGHFSGSHESGECLWVTDVGYTCGCAEVQP